MIGLLKYIRGLKFEAEPDYAYVKGQIQSIMENNGIAKDGDYDWNHAIGKGNTVTPIMHSEYNSGR